MASAQVNKFAPDTHVWISFFHRSRLEKILQQCITQSFVLVSCEEQVKEFSAVYHYPKIKDRKMLSLPLGIYQDLIHNAADFFEPQKRFALLFDYKDNYLVDLAYQTQSTLITDDHGFRMLKKISRPKVKVITLKEFYELLGM